MKSTNLFLTSPCRHYNSHHRRHKELQKPMLTYTFSKMSGPCAIFSGSPGNGSSTLIIVVAEKCNPKIMALNEGEKSGVNGRVRPGFPADLDPTEPVALFDPEPCNATISAEPNFPVESFPADPKELYEPDTCITII
ncbi:hypothetical protein L1987_10761 [Smallanthus sonchifolius]|uniref:Uncharacterized protein n=1 Tax=Smallanthus sonchifolius TaxID=185202 RepID=A0ACB9J9L6_9ASTR|nr:hypothetical protein L1987_10761 [Smallanthus sonchifolius]